MVEKADVRTRCHQFVVRHLCLPFIYRFFASLVNNTAERLVLRIPSIDGHYFFGRKEEKENNNNNIINNNDEETCCPVTLYIDGPVHMAWTMLLDAKMGLGESYMNADWRCSPTPAHLLKLLIRAKKQSATIARDAPTFSQKLKRSLLEYTVSCIRALAAVVNYAQHRLRDNTLTQSAKNIEDHYDLGNDMFALFLDPTMTYSCALYEEPCDSRPEDLETAQNRKMDALIEMLDLKETDHVLEIGCGWGACAIRAVQKTDCTWTGLTISHEQLALGKERVEAANLGHKIDLRYQDYRLAEGKFSRIISVEMIEAVGQAFLPQYFHVISDRLAPNGRAVIQAITCPDAYYDRYCQSSDFIKKHIFPGGHMPSIGAICNSLPNDLEMGEKRHIGPHYAKTLDSWFSTWMEKERELEDLGLSPRFHRKWQYYFSLCSALFSMDHIDAIQFVLHKK